MIMFQNGKKRNHLGEKLAMLTKEKITEILSENGSYLASEYGVKRIGLFGSYAKGTPY